MIPAQRQETILQRLSGGEAATINDLATELGVSHMTIRRDIQTLERSGLVVSVTGGVKRQNFLQKEFSRENKRQQNMLEKQAIGQHAASLVRDGATVYLDAGTTTQAIAENLIMRENLTIITNDFVIATIIIEQSRAALYHLGGRVDKRNASSVGGKAARMVKQFNIDMAFISSSSFDERGISTPSEEKIAVKLAAMSVSRTRVLATDSSKYGRIGSFHVADLEQFNSVITDIGIDASFASHCRAQGVEIAVTG